jgi:hypothetical protein
MSAHYYKISSYCTVCDANVSTFLQNQFVQYCMCRLCQHIITKTVGTVLYVSLMSAHYYKISSYCTVCVANVSTFLQNQFVQYCMCRLCQHIITKTVRTVLYVSLSAHYYKISSYCTVCVAYVSSLLQNQFVLYCMCRWCQHIITKSVRTVLCVSLCVAHYYKISSYFTASVAMCSYLSLCVAHYYKISSYCTLCVAIVSTFLQNQFVQ